MQAVILAAGLGRRLGPLTDSSTKCMVRLNGRPLIDYTLEALQEAGVRQSVLVLGHGAEEVQTHVGKSFRGMPVEYVLNPAYAETNNIHSLHLAGAYLAADDTLVLESDVVFDKSILADCLAHPSPNVAVVAKYEPWMDGTVTLLDEQDRIVRFVSREEFRWSESETYFKTVNIYRLSREFNRERFLPFLETYVRLSGRNAYYEEVLRVLAFMGGHHLAALRVEDKLWYEIDDVQDLDIASALFAEDAVRLVRLHERYGGYWRFPRLKDFCYLVNPYFPTRRLTEEITSSLSRLLTQYPSGARVQRLLASRMFGCDPSQLLVGNGAAELISALMAEISPRSRIGVPVPTFDEYLHAPASGTVIPFPGAERGFAYSVDDLLRFAQRERLDWLVLVNPDNPSGHFLPADEVRCLLAGLAPLGTRLILDESFVDFVDGSTAHASTHPEFLREHPTAVILKSLSKSYGVPGLRLGTLASADAALVERVGKRLPIWNVNSLAEYFLQVIGKYECDYRAACHTLTIERARLHAALQRVPFLRPYPSSANFILCEVTGDWTGELLAQRLLSNRWLLIKDCTAKKGFPAGQFVRFAVRDTADNDLLITALNQLASAPSTAPVALAGPPPHSAAVAAAS